MTLTIDRSASQNLIGTYFSLGRATPGSRSWQDDGFRVCTGNFEHPICNFAADLDLARQGALKLLDIAICRPCFNVYVLPSDKPDGVTAILDEVGFRLGHGLVQMAAEPVARRCGVELIQAQSMPERARVARFMVEQFFGRQAQNFRRMVAESTSAAIDLPLYSIEDNGNIIGATMLSDEGQVLGVYNLCVAQAHRGRGWGTELVQAIVNLAARRDRPVVLQCEESLQGWYGRQFFTSIGTVEIHNLPKSPTLAIMEQN